MDYSNLLWKVTCLFLIVLLKGTDSKVCESQGTLNDSMDLSTSIPDVNLTGITWTRPDNQFVVICNPITECKPIDGYSATVDLKQNNSMLTIKKVNLIDVGPWRITNANDTTKDYPACELRAVSIPTCNIRSDQDTEALDIGTELSLTVEIAGYYCTGHLAINIKTGHVIEEILTKDEMNELSNSTSMITFNVTSDHFGDVRLIISCDNRSRELTCDGIAVLLQRMTTVETTTIDLSTSQETSGSTEYTTDTEVKDGTENDDTVNIVLIAGIVAACVVLLLTVILMVVFRDKMKKTYKYIVAKNKGPTGKIVKDEI